MTAFARQEVTSDLGTIVWEIKSVNSRYLESNIRMPDRMTHLETQIRNNLKNNIQRGKVECTLRYSQAQISGQSLEINQVLLDSLLDACKTVTAKLPISTESLNPLMVLAWPGMISSNHESQSDVSSKLITQITQLFDATLKEFIINRNREGKALAELIENRLNTLAEETAKVNQHLPDLLKLQKQRLINRLAELKMDLNNDRVEQEMVIYAQRTDVAEELDRLNTHIDEVRFILHKEGAQGRHLDFLMQELQREANTLSAKAGDTFITSLAVSMKVLIEQMREQVQNIE